MWHSYLSGQPLYSLPYILTFKACSLPDELKTGTKEKLPDIYFEHPL